MSLRYHTKWIKKNKKQKTNLDYPNANFSLSSYWCFQFDGVTVDRDPRDPFPVKRSCSMYPS